MQALGFKTKQIQYLPVLPWACGALNLQSPQPPGSGVTLATTAIEIELTFDPGNERRGADSFRLHGIRCKDKAEVSSQERPLPLCWQGPDCITVEFRVEVSGRMGGLTLVRAFPGVVAREEIFIACFGRAVRRRMALLDYLSIYLI